MWREQPSPCNPPHRRLTSEGSGAQSKLRWMWSGWSLDLRGPGSPGAGTVDREGEWARVEALSAALPQYALQR